MTGEAVVAAVVRSCSASSLADRFFVPGAIPPDEVLARYLPYLLVDRPAGVTVAGLVDGVPVGIGTAVITGDGCADVSVLVSDGARRRGIGIVLLAAALEATGRRTAHLDVRSGNAASLALVARFARGGRRRLLGMGRGTLEYAVTPAAHVHRSVADLAVA
ncbi:MAG: GNAT family N-acetyltransferase [Pseudonocardia sp.]|nr:GNAT family N-acetyltransferase [Pseudonocardia sp.]